jgi:hypothetical protein
MLKAAEEDLDKLRYESDRLLTDKYTRGNKEHGGDLMVMNIVELLENALDENTDQRVYLLKALDEAKTH